MTEDALSRAGVEPSGDGASAGSTAGFQSRSYKSRTSQFRQCISADRIMLPSLKSLAMEGVPEEKGLRATVWKARVQLSMFF